MKTNQSTTISPETRTLKVTAFQAEEIEHRINVRRGAAEDDPESGDDFENTPGALDALNAKIQPLLKGGGVLTITEPERVWLLGEVGNMADIAAANSRRDFTGYGGWLSSFTRLEKKLQD